MNRLQIITEARTLMAEKTAASSYADATDTYNWINDGIKDMCVKGGVYLKSLSLTVVNGISTYNLPWEFLEVSNLLNHSGSPLDLIDSTHVGRVFKVTGVPLFFYFSQSLITLSPWIAATPYITWPSTALHSSTYIVPTATNGYMYECIIAGTSTAVEPTWVAIVGNKQVDGAVTWICRELISSLHTLNLWDIPLLASGGTGTYTMLYSAMDSGLCGDKVSPNIPEDKHRYLIPYLCYRWSIKNRDAQLAAAFYQEYAAGVGLPMQAQGAQQGGEQGAS